MGLHRCFTEILYEFEKQGGVPSELAAMQRFRDVLSFCDIKDLSFEGDVFT